MSRIAYSASSMSICRDRGPGEARYSDLPVLTGRHGNEGRNLLRTETATASNGRDRYDPPKIEDNGVSRRPDVRACHDISHSCPHPGSGGTAGRCCGSTG